MRLWVHEPQREKGAAVFLGRYIGIDLGTANARVGLRRRGIVLHEPSAVAVDRRSGQVVAFGAAARRMLGRTPPSIVVRRPLRAGVIADYALTSALLQRYMRSACAPWSVFRPRVIVSVPTSATAVERRAVRQAALEAGTCQAHLIVDPLGAALGAGLEIFAPEGCLVVDIGAGTADAAVLSLGGIVVGASQPVGGDRLDEAIVHYVRRAHRLVIGEVSAERVKVELGAALPGERCGEVEVGGCDAVSGLPRRLLLPAQDVDLALREPLREVIELVCLVLARTPPELVADIHRSGIVLTGGGALLRGLDRLLALELGIPVRVATDPMLCTARGTVRAFGWLSRLTGPPL